MRVTIFAYSVSQHLAHFALNAIGNMSLPLALHLAQSFGTARVKDCSTSEAESLLQNPSLNVVYFR